MNEVSIFMAEEAAPQDMKEFGSRCRSLISLWDKCPRIDWMLWILDRLHYTNRPELRLFAIWCAKCAWHVITDERSRKAIMTAEEFVRGDATRTDLTNAQFGAVKAAREATLMSDPKKAWLAWLACSATLVPSIEASRHAVQRMLMVARDANIRRMIQLQELDQGTLANKLRDVMANPFTLTRAEIDPRPPGQQNSLSPRRFS